MGNAETPRRNTAHHRRVPGTARQPTTGEGWNWTRESCTLCRAHEKFTSFFKPGWSHTLRITLTGLTILRQTFRTTLWSPCRWKSARSLLPTCPSCCGRGSISSGDRMIEGAPDIVVEILSSDRNRDLVRKRQLYAAAARTRILDFRLSQRQRNAAGAAQRGVPRSGPYWGRPIR